MALACVGLVTSIAACGSSNDSSSGGSATAAGTTAAAAPAPAVTVSKDGIVKFQTPAAGSGKGLKLGFIALGDSVPFSKLVTDSMKKNAQAAGAQLVVCDSQLDGQKALDCAKSFKSQGVKAYLNFQVDQKLAGAICKAGPQVPVIAVDIEQQPCQKAFMGAANEYAGFIAGEAVGKFAKDKWNCAYDAYVSLESTASVDASKQRMGGYRKGFQSVCPGALKNEKILDADRTDTARTKMTDTLTTLPGQKKIVVVSINDDGILGAIAAAKTAGRSGDIYLSGQGADPSAQCAIKTNPNWIADAGYFPERYGEIGIPYLIKAAKGEQIAPKLLVDHQLVSSANIDQLYTLKGC
ncbi:MAG: Monosaccharide transporter substrate-binding protein family [Conexibacter sp.]|jgi:ribose transport system substrate-binding protein|nr:Monosaccharide transporter substrate-binding protein family [Conexibacter sp.]